MRGQNEERRIERVSLPVHGNLTFVHRLQEGALRSGRRAVDFIGQKDVGENRSRAEFEFPPVRKEDAGAENVAGEQVGSELQTAELAVERACQGFGQDGLPDTRRVLDQDVPFSQQRHDRQADRFGLPEEHCADPLFKRLHQ